MMNDEKYRSEKLDFVSNLNGTSLNQLVQFITLFPLINLSSVLLKILIVINLNYDLAQIKKKFNASFWNYFLIDYIFCIVPLISICTILSEWTSSILFFLMIIISLIYMILNKKNFKIKLDDKNQHKVSIDDIELKILKFSIGTCRLWLYLLTTVSILGVDFKIFPRYLAKTETYGISLMDLGVGFYIVCHAMKIIRNDKIEKEEEPSLFNNLKKLPIVFIKELKNSSILITIGLLRLISLKLTNYVEHITEYGIHWNFMFTIVLVKLLACMFKLFVGKSAVKSFLLALAIGFYYQYYLTRKNFTSYLLLNERNRSSIIDSNKEGIFSCFGYLAIYLLSQSICLRMNSIINQKNQKYFMKSLKCIFNLLLFDLFFWFSLEYFKSNVQNVSRRLCNMSFIFYILLCSTILFTFFMASVFFVTKIFFEKLNKINQNKKNDDKIDNSLNLVILSHFIDEAFSFVRVVDSKFIGLIVFLVSNLLTGFVNITINTLNVSSNISFLILCFYGLFSYAIPYAYYFIFN